MNKHFETSEKGLLYGLARLAEEKDLVYLSFEADDWEELEILACLARTKGSYKTLIYFSEKNKVWGMIVKRKN